MNYNKDYWDNVYKNLKDKKPTYDLWLDKYKNILDKANEQYLVDLGCGSGGDSLYLTKRGYKVIACDYSKEALSIVNKFIPQARIIKLDISKTLPFENSSIEVIIADLALHYFNNETTIKIIKEIQRVLNVNGYLIGRVNSINDLEFGAGSGEEIEKNFYLTQYGYKRFFHKEDIYSYFKEFKIEYCKEECNKRYGSEKWTIEFLAVK